MAFAVAKIELKTGIRASKNACYKALCQSGNTNPWDDIYKNIIAETRGVIAPTEKSPEMLERIVEGLITGNGPSPWPSFL